MNVMKFMNGILKKTEKDHLQRRVINFFKAIEQYKTFNLILKSIKSRNGDILMEPS